MFFVLNRGIIPWEQTFQKLMCLDSVLIVIQIALCNIFLNFKSWHDSMVTDFPERLILPVNPEICASVVMV